jgi:uncharacterized protein (DUF2141 family)
MKYFLFLSLTLLFSFKIYAHGTIIISGVEHNKGYIDVKIYTDKDNFLKEELAAEIIRKKATKDQTVVPLSKVHEGTIAIVVYHDEDSNGELKTGLFWRPKEGFAFSNNYTPKGPPKFKKAAIELLHSEPVVIELNY